MQQTFLNLPTEILLKVISFLPDVDSCSNTIPSLSQTCKKLDILLRPRLFRSLTLLNDESSSEDVLSDSFPFATILRMHTTSLSLTIRHLNSKTQNFVNLRTLSVFIPSFDNTSSSLFEALKSCELLEELNIERFPYNERLLDLLGDAIAHLPLRKFSLILILNIWRRNQIRSISNHMKQFPNLHSIKIAIYDFAHEDLPFSEPDLFQNLSCARCLREFELYTSSFSEMDHQTQSTFSHFLSQTHLQSLKITNYEISSNLLNSINECQSITELNLSLCLRERNSLVSFLYSRNRFPKTVSLTFDHFSDNIEFLSLPFQNDFAGLNSLCTNLNDDILLPHLIRNLAERSTLKELRLKSLRAYGTLTLKAVSCLISSAKAESLEIHANFCAYPSLRDDMFDSRTLKRLTLRLLLRDNSFINTILLRNKSLKEFCIMSHSRSDVDLLDVISLDMVQKIIINGGEQQSLQIFPSDGRKCVPVIEVEGSDWDVPLLLAIFKKWKEELEFPIKKIVLDKLTMQEFKLFLHTFEEPLRDGIVIGIRNGVKCVWREG